MILSSRLHSQSTLPSRSSLAPKPWLLGVGAPREVVSESAGGDVFVPLADVWHPRDAETGSVPAF